ncbi:uncharacterized protein BDZ83DRAFT_656295 [Colletotrichum acutatum]|uniref:Uncharacterized protein n=1 Tax=Glomerella acutata TaxID=27357 RepID=A0AAD8UE41_GLOAC|nr:uncharacterized protein BDZ83DRAFT_656295 [Colletotrichum acutatum]KAK1713393.1 hypothetical protein BDZ83DRAFT_656295 [Colletotrichum acutatum]
MVIELVLDGEVVARHSKRAGSTRHTAANCGPRGDSIMSHVLSRYCCLRMVISPAGSTLVAFGWDPTKGSDSSRTVLGKSTSLMMARVATVRGDRVTNPSIAADDPELEPSGAEEATASGRPDERFALRSSPYNSPCWQDVWVTPTRLNQLVVDRIREKSLHVLLADGFRSTPAFDPMPSTIIIVYITGINDGDDGRKEREVDDSSGGEVAASTNMTTRSSILRQSVNNRNVFRDGRSDGFPAVPQSDCPFAGHASPSHSGGGVFEPHRGGGADR